jgi:hypothetical protein
MSKPPSKPETYALTLPVEPDQLGLFISGLLGKPQTIGRLIRGPFEIKRADIENLHHLIEQRIASQNKATLVGFTAKIAYDDASSVLLNSFVQLQTYNEVKPLASTAIHLTWTYLIQFNNKSVPEKQQIELSIVAHDLDDEVEIDREIVRRIMITRSGAGVMQLRISHTDRTWGADLDGLLTGHLKQLLVRLSGLKEFVAKRAVYVGFGVGFCLFIILMAGLYYASDQLHASYVGSMNTLTPDIAVLAGRIDKLSEIVFSQVGGQYESPSSGILHLDFHSVYSDLDLHH